MSHGGYEFEAGTPQNCPPNDAGCLNGIVYRGLRKPKLGIRPEDFLSHRANGVRCVGDECLCRGLSIWVDIKDFEHARKNIPAFKKWALAAITVDEIDGIAKKTPSNVQPNHHTFWKCQSVDWCVKANIVLAPVV